MEDKPQLKSSSQYNVIVSADILFLTAVNRHITYNIQHTAIQTP